MCTSISSVKKSSFADNIVEFFLSDCYAINLDQSLHAYVVFDMLLILNYR